MRTLASGVAVAVLGGLLVAVPPAVAAPAAAAPAAPGLVRLSGNVPPVLQSLAARPVPPAPGAAEQVLTITVGLRRGDPDGFARRLQAAQDPRSPLYHRYLTPAQIADAFGPSEGTYDAVVHWLTAQGLTLVSGSPDRTVVTLHGTRASVERAFAVTIVDYRVGPTVVYGPTGEPAVPASLAPAIASVAGLSDAGDPAAPTSDATLARCGVLDVLGATSINPLTILPVLVLIAAILEIAVPILVILSLTLDAMTVGAGLVCLWYAAADLGGKLAGPLGGFFGGSGSFGPIRANAPLQGAAPAQKIGLLEYDTFHTSDVTAWLAAAHGDPSIASRLSEVPVNGGVPAPGPGEPEVLLDIDTLMLLAAPPPTSYVVYDAPVSTPYETMIAAMVADGDTVISNSWASCEDQVSQAEAMTIDNEMAAAALAGVTVLNGSGDAGTTCLDGSPATVAVPADSPHATAVGGTTATPASGGTYAGETYWDGAHATPPTGSGGYGVSRYFGRPAYQDGFTAAAGRSVPDLSAVADPADGIEICQADAGGCPSGLQYGGTSMSTPEVAAEVADLNTALGSDVGQLNAAVYPYAHAPGAFQDATSMGSDFAHVGLGSMNVSNLVLALSHGAVGPVDTAASKVVGSLVGTADGTSASYVNAFLTDAQGNPVAGKTVTLAASSTTAVVTPLTATSTASGAVSFSVTDPVAESVTFTATDSSDNLALATQPVITFRPPAATGASIQTSPAQVPDDGTTAATVTVYLQNALGQPATGKTVTISGTGSAVVRPTGSPVAGTSAPTDANGFATFAVTDTVAENLQFTAVDATDGNLPVPGSASVTFYAGAAPVCGEGVVAAAGQSIAQFSSGYAVDPYQQLLPGNFTLGSCAATEALAFDGAGNLYAGDSYTGTVNVIPPSGAPAGPANQLGSTTFGPDDLTALAFGKDGSLYATLSLPPPAGPQDNKDPEIVQLDPATGAVLRVVATAAQGVPYCPAGMAVDPLSGDLFVSGGCSGYLYTGEIARVMNPGSATPTVSSYASTAGIGQDGIPYQLAFAPDGTLFATVGGDEIVSIGGTDAPQPAAVTQLVQYTASPNYGLGLAVTASGAGGAATTLVASAVGGHLYAIDLTQAPPLVTPLATPGAPPGVVAWERTGPDGCLYFTDVTTIQRIGPAGGACGAPGNASTQPTVALTPDSVPQTATGSGVLFTATVSNVAVPAGTPVELDVSGANSQELLADADGSGVAHFSYTGVHPGSDTVQASVLVNGQRLVSAPVHFIWTLGLHTTLLSLNGSQAEGAPGQPAMFVATLVDTTAQPPTSVPGAYVHLAVGGASCNVMTDANGRVSCELTPAGAGMLTVTASFTGDVFRVGSVASDLFIAGAPDATIGGGGPGGGNGGGGNGGGGNAGGGNAGGGGASAGGGTLPETAPVTRVGAADRVATAIAASEDAFPGTGSAGAVVLARSDAYPDALAGVPLAAALDAPLLLTPPAGLDPSVLAEVQRVLPPGGEVVLLGGDEALSTAVEQAVTAAGYQVVRYGGTDRFATAVDIAHDGLHDPTSVIEASGTDFADALVAGAAAAAHHAAVLLSDGAAAAPATTAYLAAHPGTARTAVGGPAAAADPAASPLVGTDRYATAALVAATFFAAPVELGVASGVAFPDALSGGADTAHRGGPLLLTAPDSLPAPTAAYLGSVKGTVRGVEVFGGPAAVDDSVLAAVAGALA